MLAGQEEANSAMTGAEWTGAELHRLRVSSISRSQDEARLGEAGRGRVAVVAVVVVGALRTQSKHFTADHTARG